MASLHWNFQCTWEILEISASGGSMVARLKLEGIDGGVPQDVESAVQFDPTRKSYQAKIFFWLTDWTIFHDWIVGGAWPFLARDVSCLPNCDNERDLLQILLFGTASFKLDEGGGKNRSVMPLETLGHTRTTMIALTSRPVEIQDHSRLAIALGIGGCNCPPSTRNV